MWISRREGEGFDVVLSPDLGDRIQEKLDTCQEADDGCYQNVRNQLRSSSLELDSEFKRRDISRLVPRQVPLLAALLVAVAGIFVAMWEVSRDSHLPIPIHDSFIPESQVSAAADVATASEIIVSGAGSAIMTITPTPDPTTLTG
jgi:hypothetical protein